jgi:hypothetical protein
MTGKDKTVPQLSEEEQVLTFSIIVDKTTYLNKPNMKLQRTSKLLCGMFCDAKALD